MDNQSFILFAIVGAVCCLVITGGVLSMGNSDPTSFDLGIGALVGGALGVFIPSVFDGESLSGGNVEEDREEKEKASDVTSIAPELKVYETSWWQMFNNATALTSSDSSDTPAMKVGLPTF